MADVRTGRAPHSQKRGSQKGDRKVAANVATGAAVTGSSESGSQGGQGATGREMAVEGRNGGTLIRHPPGSNGGVHRGPDRFPRRNTMRLAFLVALADNGLSVEAVRGRDAKGKRRHRSRIPRAMLEHMMQGFKNIAADAAASKPNAYGPLLRMWKDAHEILQPRKDEKAEQQPIRPIFMRACAHEQPPDQSAAAPGAPPTPPPTGLVVDGQVYE